MRMAVRFHFSFNFFFVRNFYLYIYNDLLFIFHNIAGGNASFKIPGKADLVFEIEVLSVDGKEL